MKKSIPNISSSLVFLCFIPLFSLMCWDLIRKMIAENTVDLRGLLLAFLVGVLLGLCCWVVFKFQLVKIDEKGIYAFYPFLNKRKQILWEDFHGITAEVIDPPYSQVPAHRKITLKGKKGRERIVEISLTDREFENFNALTDAIPIPKAKILRSKIDIELAEGEKYVFIMYVIASVVGILWLVYQFVFLEVKSVPSLLMLMLLFLFIGVQCMRKILWFLRVLKEKK